MTAPQPRPDAAPAAVHEAVVDTRLAVEHLIASQHPDWSDPDQVALAVLGQIHAVQANPNSTQVDHAAAIRALYHHLRPYLDALEHRGLAVAREAGVSWPLVGQALGYTDRRGAYGHAARLRTRIDNHKETQ